MKGLQALFNIPPLTVRQERVLTVKCCARQANDRPQAKQQIEGTRRQQGQEQMKTEKEV